MVGASELTTMAGGARVHEAVSTSWITLPRHGPKRSAGQSGVASEPWSTGCSVESFQES